MNAASANPSSDARICNGLSTSQGNGRSNTVIAPCGRWSGDNELPPLLNDDDPWPVLAVVASSSACTEPRVSDGSPSDFAPWLTANTASTPTTMRPMGLTSELCATADLARRGLLPTRNAPAAPSVTN